MHEINLEQVHCSRQIYARERERRERSFATVLIHAGKKWQQNACLAKNVKGKATEHGESLQQRWIIGAERYSFYLSQQLNLERKQLK